MSDSLILLGTAGGPKPKASRASPANAVVVNGSIYVVDAGNGAARQVAKAGLRAKDIRGIFITHHHSDHNLDAVALPLLAWADGLHRSISIYGPPPLQDVVRHGIQANITDIRLRESGERRIAFEPLIDVHEITGDGLVYEDDNVRITAGLVDHGYVKPAFGYRIDSEQRSVTFSGDTAPCQGLIDLAYGTDILVHEVLAVEEVERIARGMNAASLREHLINTHTSVDLVGGIAESAKVRTLVLNHFAPSDPGIPDEMWLTRASQGYSGPVIVGADLMVL